MELKTLLISDILVEDRAREDMGDIESLAESIKEKGIIQPITVDQNHKLVAGGRRLAAAKLAGLSEVSVVVRHIKDRQDAVEIELMENVARKDMTWPERARLEKQIYEFKINNEKNWSMRKQSDLVEASVGAVNRRIQLAEAIEMLPDLAKCQTEDEAWKRYKKLEENYAVSVLKKKVDPNIRDAFRWASDHYIVGDAFKGMEKTPDESVDFAEVDPPYGVDLNRRKDRNRTERHRTDTYNEIDGSEFETFFENVCVETFRILKPDTFAVFWYGMSWHTEVLRIIRSAGFSVPDIPAIWYKGVVGQTAQPDVTLGSCYEPFFVARKGKPRMLKSGRSNVFDFAKVPPKLKIHATEKPIDLLKEILTVIPMPGSTIMIPFLGSGVTLQAAYETGHSGFGWDLSNEHKKAFIARIDKEMLNAVQDQPESS